MTKINIDKLIAQAPAEASVVETSKVAVGDPDVLIEALKDFKEHDSGALAEILFGKKSSGSRGKLRELRESVNQAVLEGKKPFPALMVINTQHGKFALKVAKDQATAEAMDKGEYKNPVRKQS